MLLWPLFCCKKPQVNPVSHGYGGLSTQYGGTESSIGRTGFAGPEYVANVESLGVSGAHSGRVVDNSVEFRSLCNSAGVTAEGKLYVWAGAAYNALLARYFSTPNFRVLGEGYEDNTEVGGSQSNLAEGLIQVGADTDWDYVAENDQSPGQFIAVKTNGTLWTFGNWQAGVDVPKNVSTPGPYSQAFRAKLSCPIDYIDSSFVDFGRDRLFLPVWFTATPASAQVEKLRWDERSSPAWEPGDVTVAHGEPGGGASVECEFLGRIDTGAIRRVDIAQGENTLGFTNSRLALSFTGHEGSGSGAEAWAYSDAAGKFYRVDVVSPGEGYRHPVTVSVRNYEQVFADSGVVFEVVQPRGVVIDNGGAGYRSPPNVSILAGPGEQAGSDGQARARVSKMRKVRVQEFVAGSGGSGYTLALAFEEKTGATARAIITDGFIVGWETISRGAEEHSPLDSKPLTVRIQGDGVGATAFAVAEGSSVEAVEVFANPAVWTRVPRIEFFGPEATTQAAGRIEGIIGRASFPLRSRGSGYTKSSFNDSSNAKQSRALFMPCVTVTPSNGEFIGGRVTASGRVIGGEAMLVPGGVVGLEENPQEFYNRHSTTPSSGPPSVISQQRFVTDHNRWRSSLRVPSAGQVSPFSRFLPLNSGAGWLQGTELLKVPFIFWPDYIEQCVTAYVRGPGHTRTSPLLLEPAYSASANTNDVLGVLRFSLGSSGSGYTYANVREIRTNATGVAVIDHGRVVEWRLTSAGSPNLTSQPLACVITGDGTGATATAVPVPGVRVVGFAVANGGEEYTQATAIEQRTGARANAVIDSNGRITGWVVESQGLLMPSPVLTKTLSVSIQGDGQGAVATPLLSGDFGVQVSLASPITSLQPPALCLEFLARPHRVVLKGNAAVSQEVWSNWKYDEIGNGEEFREEWYRETVGIYSTIDDESGLPSWYANTDEAIYGSAAIAEGPNGAVMSLGVVDGKLVEQDKRDAVAEEDSEPVQEVGVSGGIPYLGPLQERVADDPMPSWSMPSQGQRVHFMFPCDNGTPAYAVMTASSLGPDGLPKLTLTAIEPGFGYREEPVPAIFATIDPVPVQQAGLGTVSSAGFVEGAAMAIASGQAYWWGSNAAILRNRRSSVSPQTPGDLSNIRLQYEWLRSHENHTDNYTATPTLTGRSLAVTATGSLTSYLASPSQEETNFLWWRWPRPDHGNRVASPSHAVYPRPPGGEDSEIATAIGFHDASFPARRQYKPWDDRQSRSGAGYISSTNIQFVGPPTTHSISFQGVAHGPPILRVGGRFLLDSTQYWRRFGAEPSNSHMPPLVSTRSVKVEDEATGIPSVVPPAGRTQTTQITTSETGRVFPREYVAVIRNPGTGGAGFPTLEDSQMSESRWLAGMRQAAIRVTGGVRSVLSQPASTSEFENEDVIQGGFVVAQRFRTTTTTETQIVEVPGEESLFYLYLSSDGGLPCAVFGLGSYTTPPTATLLNAGSDATVEVVPVRDYGWTDDVFSILTRDPLAPGVEPHKDLAIDSARSLCGVSARLPANSEQFLTKAESAAGKYFQSLQPTPLAVLPDNTQSTTALIQLPYPEEEGIGEQTHFVVLDSDGFAYSTYVCPRDVRASRSEDIFYLSSPGHRIVGPLRRLAPLAIALTDTGFGYDYPVVVDVPQPEGVAEGVCEIDGTVVSLAILDGGERYESAPNVRFYDELGAPQPGLATAEIAGPVASVSVNSGGAGYRCPPLVVFHGSGGPGDTGVGVPAKAEASIAEGKVIGVRVIDGGRYHQFPPQIAFAPQYDVESISVTNPGDWYQGNPDVEVVGGGGSGASARARISAIVFDIEVTRRGGPYILPPDVYIIPAEGDTGIGATAVAVLGSDKGVDRIQITSPGQGYQKPPRIVIGGGASAFATIRGGVVEVIIESRGCGYESPPLVLISGKDGTGAEAVATIAARGSGATATARLNGSVVSSFVTDGGAAYQKPPIVICEPTQPAGQIDRIEVTSGGSGYTSQPGVSIAGGGSAVAVVADGRVVAVLLTSETGSYSSPPAVAISGGGGQGAFASAVLKQQPSPAYLKATILGQPTSVVVTKPGDGYREPLHRLPLQPGPGGHTTLPAIRRRVPVFAKGSFQERPTFLGFEANRRGIELPRYRNWANSLPSKRMNLRYTLGLATVESGGPGPVAEVLLPRTVVGLRIVNGGSGYTPYSFLRIRVTADGTRDEAFRHLWRDNPSSNIVGDSLGVALVGPDGDVISVIPNEPSGSGRGLLAWDLMYTTAPTLEAIPFSSSDEGSGAIVEAVLGHPLECYYAPQVLFDGHIEVEADVTLKKVQVGVQRVPLTERPPNHQNYELRADCYSHGAEYDWGLSVFREVPPPEEESTSLFKEWEPQLFDLSLSKSSGLKISASGQVVGLVPTSSPAFRSDEEIAFCARPVGFFSVPPQARLVDEKGLGAVIAPLPVGPLSFDAIQGIALVSGGQDYTLASKIKFFGGLPLARSAVPAAAVTIAESGVITDIVMQSPGAGHTVPPSVYILGDGEQAEAVVSQDDIDPATGEIIGITLTRGGRGYSQARVVFVDNEKVAEENPRVAELEQFIEERYSVLLRNATISRVERNADVDTELEVSSIGSWGSSSSNDPWDGLNRYDDMGQAASNFLHACGIRLHNAFADDGFVSYLRVVGHQGETPDARVGIPAVTITSRGASPPLRVATGIATTFVKCDPLFSGTAMRVTMAGGKDFPPWQLSYPATGDLPFAPVGAAGMVDASGNSFHARTV